MSEGDARAAIPCPACSPDAETVHEVVKPGTPATVRCTACDHVHKARVDPPEAVTRDVVVSQDGKSFTATVEAPADETVSVGEEFVLDTEEAIMGVRITDLEVGPEQRAAEAPVRDVETFWTRAVDNVAVDMTIHPADGRRDETRSVTLYIPGDHAFVVGEEASHGEETVEIEGIVLREDASGYPARKLDHPGDTVEAKDVTRVYAREVGSRAWSAW